LVCKVTTRNWDLVANLPSENVHVLNMCASLRSILSSPVISTLRFHSFLALDGRFALIGATCEEA